MQILLSILLLVVLTFASAVHAVDEIVPGIEDPGIEFRQKLKEKYIFNYFALGTTAPIEWFTETRAKNGAQWHFKQAYFSGGAGWDGKKGSWDTVFLHNWNKWVNPDKRKGVWAEKFIEPAVKEGFIPWITMYNLAQSYPADYKPGPAQATPINARNTETMRAYWEQIKLIMQLSNKYAPHPIVIHVEPDEWGHLLLSPSQRMDWKAVDIKVGSTGMPELKGLEDNLRGYSHAFLKLRAMYAPKNVILITNPSAWDQNGSMNASNWVKIFKECDVTAWDAAVLETGDRDIGCNPGKNLAPPYDVVDTTGSHFNNLNEQLNWIKTFTSGTKLPVYFWQVGLGNYYYRSCNQTEGHFCDRIAQALLEDYPKNKMIAKYVSIGCYGFVFSPGQGHQTHCYDQRKDGITNPDPITGNLGHMAKYADDDGGYMRERAGMYYKDPYPILAERVARKKDESKKVRRKRGSTAAKAKKKLPKPTTAAWGKWSAHLKTRAAAVCADGKRPLFHFSMLKKEVELRSVGEKCKLFIPSMGSEMTFDLFKGLKTADASSLAAAVTDESSEADNAMLAFFMTCNGDEAGARPYLYKSSEVLRKEIGESFEPEAEAETE